LWEELAFSGGDFAFALSAIGTGWARSYPQQRSPDWCWYGLVAEGTLLCCELEAVGDLVVEVAGVYGRLDGGRPVTTTGTAATTVKTIGTNSTNLCPALARLVRVQTLLGYLEHLLCNLLVLPRKQTDTELE
jgi:hypothetical protein